MVASFSEVVLEMWGGPADSDAYVSRPARLHIGCSSCATDECVPNPVFAIVRLPRFGGGRRVDQCARDCGVHRRNRKVYMADANGG
jgi:hypothetical protein